jgi:D-glycero-alpha-D-manno-heptose 1-phosphate guanylyltransferase
MIAIVLVGGKQSLVSELYPDLPTPLIPVCGEPFLYWLTQWLKAQGFKHIVYAANHYAEKITAWAQHLSSIEPSLCLDVVTEARPLGTAGAAILCAKRYPSSITYVTNGDSILLTDSRTAIKRLSQHAGLDAIIFGTNVMNAGRFGTLEVDNNNHLLAFREKQPGKGPINAGVYLLRNELFQDMTPDKESSLEYDSFPQWIAQGKSIEVIENDSPFIDIGTPDSLKRAQEMILRYQPIIMGQKQLLIA